MAEGRVLIGRGASERRIGLFGIPYDAAATLGRPGARYAPARVRDALRWNLNRVRDAAVFDVEAQRLVRFDRVSVEDLGDIDIAAHDHLLTLERARTLMAELLTGGLFPIALGGDHSVSLPLLQAFHDHFPGPLGIVQLDAHLDLVDETPRQGRFSGSSQMRRALEMGRYRPSTLVQVGVRGFNYPDQYDYVQAQGVQQIPASEVHRIGGAEAARRAIELASAGGADVYFTLDVDCLDPAFAPGTGGDEPGGLTSAQVLDVVREIVPRVRAMDIVEVNPMADRGDVTSTLAAQILFVALTSLAGAWSAAR